MRVYVRAGFAVLAGFGASLAAVSDAGARARRDTAFRPDLYFAGVTRASGVMENTLDGSTSRFTGVTRGHRERDGLTVFDQTIRFEDGSVRTRTWRIVQTGSGTIEVTGTDIVGTAHGEVRGRELHLLSTIRADAGNPLTDVDFEQTLTLGPDGRTVYNRSTVRKLGIILRKARETFVRAGSVTR